MPFSPNSSNLLSNGVDNTTRNIVPKIDSLRLQPAGGGKRLRRWTGGWVYNDDETARIVRLSLFDGTTRTFFRRTNLLAGESLIFTDKDDGFEMTQDQQIDIDVTTVPVVNLSAAMTFEDI